MVQLFNLTVPADRSRSDIDAYLRLDGLELPFELKSTTSGSVSTVRDFGADHIAKWRAGLHWLFGFYNREGTRLQYCCYASPADMEPWIAEKERYVRPDLMLAESVPSLVTAVMVVALLGNKESYTLADAKWIMKNQWRADQYRAARDLDDGYSLQRMTELLSERCHYVIQRGATLNNPHIESRFFTKFERITEEHAGRLRELVRAYLADSASTTDDATA